MLDLRTLWLFLMQNIFCILLCLCLRLGILKIVQHRCATHGLHGPVVQLVRAPACHAGSCGFESRPVRLILRIIITKGHFKWPFNNRWAVSLLIGGSGSSPFSFLLKHLFTKLNVFSAQLTACLLDEAYWRSYNLTNG